MSQVVISGLEDVQRLLDKLPENAKFGASVGLNRTADEVQTAIREGLAGRFTLRRKTFVERTIYRKPGEDFAHKGQPQLFARVRVHEERDVLAKHERGGDKTPISGKALAVPIIGGARPTKGAVVPHRYALKTLFFGREGLGSQARTIASTRRKGQRKTLLKRSAKTSDVAVIDGVVYLRTGSSRNFKLKALWVFKSSVRITPRLDFEEIARRVAGHRLAPNVIDAIAIELQRGLTTSSGPRSP